MKTISQITLGLLILIGGSAFAKGNEVPKSFLDALAAASTPDSDLYYHGGLFLDYQVVAALINGANTSCGAEYERVRDQHMRYNDVLLISAPQSPEVKITSMIFIQPNDPLGGGLANAKSFRIFSEKSAGLDEGEDVEDLGTLDLSADGKTYVLNITVMTSYPANSNFRDAGRDGMPVAILCN